MASGDGTPRSSGPMGPLDVVLTTAVCGVLGGVSKFIMQVLNHTEIVRADVFQAILLDEERRRARRGVVTVSNHVSAVDDPGAVSVLLPYQSILDAHLVRWTMCATDRCFKNPFAGAILRKGKVMPIERGRGVKQPLMDDVIARLDEGDWVHMFPEGTRSRTGTMGRMRPGVGRLVADAERTPVVVPFYHTGMETILRVGAWIPLNVGQKLRVVVGDPIDFGPMIEEHRRAGLPEEALHKKIADRIGDALADLARKEGKGGIEPEVPLALAPTERAETER